jgi:DNA-binding NtrC family response regulator
MSEQRQRILIVEDDVAVAQVMAAALDDQMLVDTCSSAEHALLKINDTRYDVVCADYGLPKMNGLDLLEKLAQRPEPLRGLLVTGSEDFYRVSKRRGYYVLKKPFDPERLVSVVAHLAKLASMRQTVGLMATGPAAGRK